MKKKIEQLSIPEPNSGCWLWTGTLHSQNHDYGRIWIFGRLEYAHRISYQIYKGKLPPGTEIDHLCKNKICVNPDHLEAVTSAMNTRRAYRKGSCINGHKLDGDNLICLSGKRTFQKRCKICHQQRMYRYRHEQQD